MSRYLSGTALWVVALAAASVPAYAQVVTSSIRGEVLSTADGNPVAGAQVEIIDTRINSVNRQTTGADGFFTAPNLDIGGPYTVRVTAPGFKTREIPGISITLGEPFRLLVDMQVADAGATEKVVVVGQRVQQIDRRGVGTSFGAQNIEEYPSVILNDPKEIIAQSPLAYIDFNAPQNPISIAGRNPRCNSFNVDGVPQNDSFGLNQGGYPTARGPLPLQWIKQLQVAVSPYDTEYNDFCGGVINAVTKTGENEFHGGIYYKFKDQDLIGKDLPNGTSPTKNDFVEETYGAYVSGPIWADNLWFFAGYDRVLRTAPQPDFGPADANVAIPIADVTTAELNQIISISQTKYGFNPGGLLNSFTEDNTRWMGKLNWQINENHRAQIAYQEAEGGTLENSRFSTAATGLLGLSSNRYIDAERLKSYTLQVFSDWTDDFSTEFRLGRVKVKGDQDSLNGNNFPEIYVQADNVPGNQSTNGYVILGGDQFRHFNELAYRFDSVKLTGTYTADSHLIKGGYERKMLRIFNGFVQGSDGIFRFDSIDDFDAGIVSTTDDTFFSVGRGREPIRYANAPDNNPATASASWGYNVDTFYLQDDWEIDSNFAVMAGLRYDRYTSEGTIRQNAGFLTTYGFSNTKDLGGLDIILPRASFSYDIPGETEEDLSWTIRGGVGRYSGGSPNVWISNSYSNDGLSYVQVQGVPGAAVTGGFLPAANFIGTPPVNFNLSTVPASLQSLLPLQVGNGPVNALAQDFELPNVWRGSLGVDVKWDGWQATAEYMYNDDENQIFYRDLRMAQRTASNALGTAPAGGRIFDGRILYDHINDIAGATLRPKDGSNDLVVYNDNQGHASYIILAIKKDWDYSEDWGRFGVNFGYTNSKVIDLGGGTSSTAFSNWANRSFVNVNEPEAAQSDYERRHRFTVGGSWAYQLFGFMETRVKMFGQAMSGQGFSYTFTGNPFNDTVNIAGNPGGVAIQYMDNLPSGRALLYVPRVNAATGLVDFASDPNVTYAAGWNAATMTSFNSFIQNTGLVGYNGQIAPRNAFDSPWINRIDVGLEQEVQLFDEHRAVLEFNIFNFGNLLNRQWGHYQSPSFPQTQTVVNANYDAETNRYQFNSFSTSTINLTRQNPSLWQMQVGVRYEF